MRNKRWARLLAYVTGTVNQELLLQNEYLAAENRILRAKLPSTLRLSNRARHPRRDRQAPGTQSTPRGGLRRAQPDAILAWYRKFVAEKFDGSKHRQYPGRPRIGAEVEALVVQMARGTRTGI